MGTISDVLYCARDWIGYSRWTDPEEGTVFGRWFAEKTGEPYFGVSGVPYCAMFSSYCLDWAGVPCAGMPSAYCPDIVNAGEDAGATVSCEDAEPGDLVLFDWGGDGLADHIGIVEENHPGEGYMTTIEGNTSSGAGGSYMVEALQSKIGVDADGYFGPDTCRALQSYLGTYADGYVDYPSNMVRELQRRLNDNAF